MQKLLGRSQAVLPQCQNVSTCVEVSIYLQSATGAGIGAVREGELLPMSTSRAVLTRIRGVHCHILSTGPCCLVRKKGGELTPRGVMNAFGQTMVMRHPVDRQVFNGDQIKLLDHATAVLVGEITPSPGATFMHAGDDLTPSCSLRRPLLFVRKAPLCFGKGVLLLAKEAGIGNLLASSQ